MSQATPRSTVGKHQHKYQSSNHMWETDQVAYAANFLRHNKGNIYRHDPRDGLVP
jgi:hypothetical protein